MTIQFDNCARQRIRLDCQATASNKEMLIERDLEQLFMNGIRCETRRQFLPFIGIAFGPADPTAGANWRFVGFVCERGCPPGPEFDIAARHIAESLRSTFDLDWDI